jgi:hypothetical protein
VSGAGLAAFDTSPRVEVRPDFDAPPQLNLAQRDSDRLRGRIDGLRTAASETGGTAIVDGNDCGAGFDPIVRQLSAYYLLAYRSSGNDDDGAFRKIEVRISDRTVDVRARRGYWPGESGNPAHEEPLESTIGRALADGGEIDFGSARLLESARIFRATPAPRSPLEPTRDPDFRRTERIHVEWMKTAELDSQRARLLSRTGVELPMPVAIREAHTEGRPALHVDLNLAPLAPGEYAIEVIVRRGTIEDRRVVAVRVSR